MNYIEQAIERGFVKGVKFKSARSKLVCYLNSSLTSTYIFDSYCIKPSFDAGCIYKCRIVKGKLVEHWAEIICTEE